MDASLPSRHLGDIGEEEQAAVVALLDRAIAAGEAPGYNGHEEEVDSRSRLLEVAALTP